MWKALEEALALDPLRDYSVDWLEIQKSDVDQFEQCLNDAKREEDVQQYLQQNPILLSQLLRGGHGRWVIPKQKLGNQYVTDFILGEAHSDGHDWQVVELESPLATMFTKKGDPTARLVHGETQIQNWRSWLNRNQNYAARPRNEEGLGLTDIVPSLPGLVLIGRRRKEDEAFKDLRRQRKISQRIEVHSYDFLVDCGSQAAKAYKRLGFGRRRKRQLK